MVEVVLKGRMLNGADVVGADVEEDTDVKGQPVNPLDQVSLAGHLHNQVSHAVLDRPRHHGKEVQAFRRGQGGLEEGLAVQRGVHGRKHGRFLALFKDVKSKISRRCLTLGAGESQEFELFLRMTMKFHGNQAHSLLDVVDDDSRNADLIVDFRHVKSQSSLDSFFQKFLLKGQTLGKKRVVGLTVRLS